MGNRELYWLLRFLPNIDFAAAMEKIGKCYHGSYNLLSAKTFS
jgi:hypothetical protein